MTLFIGAMLVIAGLASAKYITGPGDGAKIPGIEIPGLIFACALVFSGIHVMVDPSWSVWPTGKWLVISGDVGAVFCLFMYAVVLPDFVWAVVGIPILSLVSILGSGGSLVAYIASHVNISWS